MSRKVIIVGAGVVGLSAAWYAAERGFLVTVLDRAPEERAGASYVNAGYVTPSHVVPLAAPGMLRTAFKYMWNDESPFYVKPRLDLDLISWGWKFYRAATPQRVERAAPVLRDLNFAGRDCYRQLAREFDNEFELVENGILNLCSTEHGLEHEAETAAFATRVGSPAEMVTPADVETLEPKLRIRTSGGAFYPNDAILAPGKFMDSLGRHLAERGVAFLWQTEVTGWRTNANHVEAIRTSRGDLSADEFVICGGAWSPGIAKGLEVRVPIEGGKGYSLTLASPPQQAVHGIILTEARVALTPIGESLRFGGTMEIAGLHERMNPARVRGIVKSALKHLPDFSEKDFEGVQASAGLRPCSPDGLPYIGRFDRWQNVAVGTGHAMMGMSLGPVTGKILGEVLAGVTPSVSLELLSPDRYSD